MTEYVFIKSTGNGHSGKHHLTLDCPWIEPENSYRKKASVYPELDVCAWCKGHTDRDP
jgi:hypothetical protein